VSELVAAAVSEKPPAARDDILRVMLELGEGGIQALRQLALYGTPPVRLRALQSLSRIDRRANMVELVTALHAADSSEAEVETARTRLQPMGGIPSRESSLQILTLDLADKQNRATLTDNDDQTVTLWSAGPARDRAVYQSTLRILAAYRDVADAGARLRRVGGLSAATQGAVLVADMAYRVMVDPDWGDPEQVEAFRKTYGVSASGPALSAAIARSLEDGDHTATIGLMRLIDPASASVLNRSQLLVGNGASPTPLVRAASSPEPQVRYEAALLVSRLAQEKPFPGSSYVRGCLSEMSALSDRPTAILVETRADVIIPIELILGDLGFDVKVVGNVGQLQRVVARGGDLRLILSKTQLADLSPIEMTDRVRRTHRGRQLPIVFYGPEPPGLVTARWQAPTVLIGRPTSPTGLDDLREMVRRRRRLPPLSIIDRQTYRDAATQLLDPSARAG
jgi:CheY-like chemotaxis protein